MNIIDDPMFKAEVMQAIGPRLTVFWKLNKDPGSLVVLETVVEQGVSFVPLKGEVEIIKF